MCFRQGEKDMYLFVFLTIFFIWAFASSVLCCIFFKRARHTQDQIDHLIEENANKTKELNTVYQKSKNPLGPWLTPTGKSYTLHLDKNGKITQIDDNLLELLGYRKKDLLNKNIYGTLIPTISAREPLETNIVHRIFANPRLYTDHETELSTKSGSKVWITWTNKMVYDAKKRPVELYSVGFDITKRKNLESELQFLASTDPQTGVLNKQALLEIGTRELKRSIRYKHDFSVLSLKIYLLNDETLDQQIGDKILQQVVTLCRHSIRDVDYLGRIDETEFCMLLPETPANQVIHLQDRIQQKIDDYNQKSKSPARIRVDFNSTGYTAKDSSVDDIIIRALENSSKKKVIK